MVGHYLIQYRSVTTGIPVFLVNTHNKCGRGKADIMDNLKDWTGLFYFSIFLLSSQLFEVAFLQGSRNKFIFVF